MEPRCPTCLLPVALLAMAAPAGALEVQEGDESLPEDEPVDVAPACRPPVEVPLAPSLGLDAGFLLPVEDLGVGSLARVELGARLPWLEGRLLPFVTLGFGVAADAGVYADPRLPEDYAWDLSVRQGSAGGGLRVRVLGAEIRVSPELAALGEAVRVHAVQTGVLGGAAVTPIHEVTWSASWTGSAGLVMELGPGHLVLDLGYRHLPLDGVLTGAARGDGLVTSVGFRRTAW